MFKHKRSRQKKQALAKTTMDPLVKLAQKIKSQKDNRQIQPTHRFKPKNKLLQVDKTGLKKAMQKTTQFNPILQSTYKRIEKQVQEIFESWQDPFNQFLAKNGMQHIRDKFEQKGINCYSKLIQMKADEVQNLDIGIGYKIKVRKQLQRQSNSQYKKEPPLLIQLQSVDLKVQQIIQKRRNTVIDECLEQQQLQQTKQDNINKMFSQEIIMFKQPQIKTISTTSNKIYQQKYCYQCWHKFKHPPFQLYHQSFCCQQCAIQYQSLIYVLFLIRDYAINVKINFQNKVQGMVHSGGCANNILLNKQFKFNNQINYNKNQRMCIFNQKYEL